MSNKAYKYSIGQRVWTEYGGYGTIRSHIRAYGENIYRIHGKTDSSDYPEDQVRKTKPASMKPTTVYITKGKHASQKYTVLIQPPKGEAYFVPNPKNGKPQRYARAFTAKRGAARNVGGYPYLEYSYATGKYKLICYRTQNGVPIKFVLK